METFRDNSEKVWDKNQHPWDRLDSSFLSTHTRSISRTGRVHSNSPEKLSTHLKYFVYIKKEKKGCDIMYHPKEIAIYMNGYTGLSYTMYIYASF